MIRRKDPQPKQYLMYILVDASTNNFGSSSFAATQKKTQYVVDERKNTQREDVPGDRHEEDVNADADADRIGDVWGSSCPGKSTC